MNVVRPNSGRRNPRRRGYVLVMVLALLVLAASLFVAVGRATLRTSLAARSAEEDLQRRWGVGSCRKAVLPNVEAILAALEQERREPAARYAATLRLGTQRFELILADEQAKANVNAMLEAAGAERTEARLREGLSGSGLPNRVKLRPTYGAAVRPVEPATSTAAASRPTVSGSSLSAAAFGQVFDNVAPAQLIRPTPGTRLAASDLLTCWGDGAVNVRRAPEAALVLAAGRSLTGAEIGRLVDARNKVFERRAGESSFDASPVERLRELITKAAGESLKNRGNLGLVERSNCHSLWVVSRAGSRDGYDLFVYDASGGGRRPHVSAFSW
jgi:hypothetical protein